MYNFNLNDFFAAFKSMRAGRTQSPMESQGFQRGCCQGQSFMPSQAFDYPDADVRFDAGCGCHRDSGQFNMNTGIVDGPGNDIYDAPGKDVYAFGNRGIIDTEGNDMYVRNFSVNTFNTVNNFYKMETPTVEPTPTPTVDPPSPTAAPTVQVSLTPLRNLLTGIEKLQPDGVVSDAELNKAIANPHYADLDGDANTISAEEMAIFNKIKELNTDKDLLSNVMKGDYSNISDDQMTELGALSDAIKELTQRR